jgi:hypothetical protein
LNLFHKFSLGAGTIPYEEIYFSKAKIFIQNKKFEYYSSPILSQNNFKHAYFTKSSSEKFIQLLGDQFNKNYINCISNQIHSNVIVFGSHSQEGCRIDADGLVGNKCNQNLWVYTADCMPIFFADKRTRYVAALHCGRRGLEKNIIKKLVKIFDNIGTSRDDLLVAIGPSISKGHYLVDKTILKEFYRKTENKRITVNVTETEKDLCFCVSNHLKKQNLYQLDLKRSAYRQLLNENIPNTNIDISNLCTYKLKNEFNSWRRSKTISRQWNFICS